MTINARPMFDRRMLERLRDFWPSTVDILIGVVQPDSMGTPESDFEVVYEGVPCAIAPFNDIIPISGERKLEMLSYGTITHRLTLKGYFPLITDKMVARFDDINYNILGVEFDSNSIMTRIIVNDVTI